MKKKKRSEVLLCYPLEQRRLIEPKFNWRFPVLTQPKLDGVRCRAVCNGKNVVLLSSTCAIISSVPHIVEKLQSMNLYVELDGELYIHGESFETINSIVSRTVNLHESHQNILFHIFDLISDEDQLTRILSLRSLKNLDWPLEIVTTLLAKDFSEILVRYEEFLADGYEGIIVRHRLAPYIRRRSTFVMKFKPKKSDIYKITGYKEEVSIAGDPKDRLGALICMGNDMDEFSVGSGFDHDARVKLWQERETLVGRYVKVAYQSITTKKGVPRFPIFLSVLTENPELESESETNEGGIL